MRIALAQLNFTVGAFEANFEKIAGAVQRAAREQADLIVFSELATTGYPPRDLLTHPQSRQRAEKVQQQVRQALGPAGGADNAAKLVLQLIGEKA